MTKIEQAYIDSELLDIDEDNPYVIFQAGYKTGENEIKKSLEMVNKSIQSKDYVAAVEILSEILQGAEK